MKKIIYSMLALFVAAFTFSSCEDVPQPYDTPTADSSDAAEDEATGDGSLSSPFNTVAANELGETLSSGETTDDYYYIQGIVYSVSEEFSTSYGNATFYISPDGSSSNKFYCYRVYYIDNKKWTSSDEQIEVGDSVIVYAKITNYSGTIETAQSYGYVYYHNGTTGSTSSESTGEATGSGTLDDPYNSVAANEIGESLTQGSTTDDYYYIKGLVASITEEYSESYGNATFYISDDGSTSSTTFYCYRVYYLDNEKWTSSDTQIAVGDEVIVYAKIMNYYGTAETAQYYGYVYSHTSNGGTSSDDDSDDSGVEVTDSYISFTAESFGLENAYELSTLTLSDGTTLTFDQGTGSTSPKYYTNGTNFRVYPGNTLTIESPNTISSVVIECDEVSSVICNAGEDVSASPGSVSFDDVYINIASVNSTSTVITNTSTTTGTASQIRIVAMTIYYAD